MRKKKNQSLKFENKFKMFSSKKGGFVLIILEDGTCLTIPALKLMRTSLISLSIKNRHDLDEAA